MADNSRIRELVSASQNAAIERAVLSWINDCPLKPRKVEYSFLGKTSGIAIGTIQSAYKIARYILGGYRGQYQFEIRYRLIAENADERIFADELLNSIAEWMEQNIPDPPDGVSWWKINRNTGAAPETAYDNGAEDHTIQLTIIFEVI